ncbi:MAG: TerB family tellurite resistance protein [Planctomycetota bacterium]
MSDIEGVSHNGVRRIYRVLCHLAHCDGEVASQERGYLDDYRRRFEIADVEGTALEAEGAAGQSLGVGRRPEERQLMIDSMIDITMIDGVLSTAEQERLAKFAITFGLDKETLAKRIVERIKSTGRKLKGS